MFPSKALWTVGLQVPDSMASRNHTIHTEEPEFRQLAYFRSTEDC